MFTHLLVLGLIDGAGEVGGAVDPPVVYAGGYGVSPQRRLTPEEDAALDRALFGLEDSIRKARTPRVRRAKLRQAERHAESVASILANIMPEPPPALDLSEVRLTLNAILAGHSSFPDWRMQLLDMVNAARIEAELLRQTEDLELAMFMLLVS
jgi:hypothetical protein